MTDMRTFVEFKLFEINIFLHLFITFYKKSNKLFLIPKPKLLLAFMLLWTEHLVSQVGRAV